MRLEDFRKQYPQYQDISDQNLAKSLHQKFYSDIPFNDFSKSIGLGGAEDPISAEQRASDYGRLISAAAIQTTAAAPEGALAAATAVPRAFATGEAFERGPLLPRILDKSTQLIRAALGTSLTEQQEERLAAKISTDKFITQAKDLFELPKFFEYLSEEGGDLAEGIRKNVSLRTQEQLKGSTPTGNLIEAISTGDFSGFSLGDRPTFEGYVAQGVQVLGSLAPVIATAILTKGATAPGAIVGGATTGGEGAGKAKEYVENLSDSELLEMSPYYATMRGRGIDQDIAKRIISDRAAEQAAFLQGAVGALGGVFTSKLVTGKLDDYFTSNIRNRLGRVVALGGVGALEEGTQEFLEGIAADVGINKEVIKELGEDSFANLILGAIAGGGIGAGRGAISKSPKPKTSPSVLPPSSTQPTPPVDPLLPGQPPAPAPPIQPPPIQPSPIQPSDDGLMAGMEESDQASTPEQDAELAAFRAAANIGSQQPLSVDPQTQPIAASQLDILSDQAEQAQNIEQAAKSIPASSVSQPLITSPSEDVSLKQIETTDVSVKQPEVGQIASVQQSVITPPADTPLDQQPAIPTLAAKPETPPEAPPVSTRTVQEVQIDINRTRQQARRAVTAARKGTVGPEFVSRLEEKLEALENELIQVRAAPRRAAPKYRDSKGNTWTGRGLQPTWLKNALKEGRNIDEFVILSQFDNKSQDELVGKSEFPLVAPDAQRDEIEQKIEASLKKIRSLERPTGQDNLFTMLRGKFPKGYFKNNKIDITDSLRNKLESDTGRSTLDGIVETGILDRFFKEESRVGNLASQRAEGTSQDLSRELDVVKDNVETLQNKLESNDPLSEDTNILMRDLDIEIQNLDKELKLEDVNRQLSEVAIEERGIAQQVEADAIAEQEGTAALPERQTGEQDFKLTGQTQEELAELERKEKTGEADREIEEREAKELADRARDIFTLERTRAEPTPVAPPLKPTGDMFGAASVSKKEEPTVEKLTEGDVLLIEADESDFADALDVSGTKDPRLEELFNTKQNPAKPQAQKFLSQNEADKIVNEWKQEAARQGRSEDNSDKTVISLFDASGEWSKPWAEAGFKVVTYDLQTGDDIRNFSAASLLEEHGNDNVWAVLAAPPCTDFASSGAQYWKSKDKDGRTEISNDLVQQVIRTVELLRPAVWAMENPVGRMAKLNQLPSAQLTFQPNLYGNPYTKKTLLWGNFNNKLPQAPVEPTEGSKIIKLSGGNKYERSLTPDGFAYSFFVANNPVNMTQEERLSREFHGITPAEFKNAGKEEEIRDSIQDDYFDGNLEQVKKTLAELVRPETKKEIAIPSGTVVSIKNLPDAMQARSFKTSDGYGVGLYDLESENTVPGSIRRFRGDEALQKAQTYLDELSKKITSDHPQRKTEGIQPLAVKIEDKYNELRKFSPETIPTWESLTPAQRSSLTNVDSLNKFTIENIKELVNEQNIIDVEAIEIPDRQRTLLIEQTSNLTEAQNKTLESHYGSKAGTDAFLNKLSKDISTFVNKGASFVAERIRGIIEQLAKAVIALGIVFNPNIIGNGFDFDLSNAYATIQTKNVTATVPSEVASQMSNEAKMVYQQMAPLAKETQRGFIIADKPNGTLHMFFSSGQHLATDTALYGKDIGDTFQGDSLQGGKKITPAGKFTLQTVVDKNQPGGYRLDLVETNDGIGVIAIHPAYLGDVKEKRLERLASSSATDKRISYGCINTSHETFLKKLLPQINQFNGGIVFVLPDKPEIFRGESGRVGLFNIERDLSDATVDNKNREIERDEKINYYASIRRKLVNLQKKVRDYGSTIDIQRSLNNLEAISRQLKEDISSDKVSTFSAESFMKQARAALDGTFPYKQPEISQEVFDVIQALYNEDPKLLEGLRLSVKQDLRETTGTRRSTGEFRPFQRIVRLFANSSGVTKPSTIRHEITHALEQMMNGPQREALLNSYFDAVKKAAKKYKDPKSQLFFDKLVEFLNNPSKKTQNELNNALPSYDLYQYVNPSEYWAVNAEKLMGQRLGTSWEKFKKSARKILEKMKDLFGFDNRFAVHSVFDQIMSGSKERLSKDMLIDFVSASGEKFKFLSNIQDDEKLMAKSGRGDTPMLDATPVKTMVSRISKLAKNSLKDMVQNPSEIPEMFLNPISRGITRVRNSLIWYGTGLNEADRIKYNGQVRTSNFLATASLALENMLRGGNIATQVLFMGGLEYDKNTLQFSAVKKDKSMVNVYKAEAVIKNRLGEQLGTNIIQGYLEALRSRSIKQEAILREKLFDKLKGEVDAKVQEVKNLDADPKATLQQRETANSQLDTLIREFQEAKKDFEVIKKIAEDKINMTDQEIDDFIARDKVHPELKEIIENFSAVNQNMLRLWRMVGLLSEKRYQVLSRVKDYVPWYRIMDDEVDIQSPLQATTKSATNIGKEKVFGPGRPVVVNDFIVEQNQTVFKIQPSKIDSIKLNNKKLKPSDYTMASNGEITLNVPFKPGDTVSVKTQREIENIIDNMTRNVMRMTMSGLQQYAAQRIVSEYATRNPNGKIKTFDKIDLSKGRFDFIRDGRRTVVEIDDPLIAEAAIGLQAAGMVMWKPLAAAANFTRRTITLSPVFQVKQVFKDAPTAALVTGVKRPDLLIGGVYKGFFSALTGSDPAVSILRSAGIGGFQSLARTPEAEVKRRIGVINNNTFDYAMQALDHIGDSSDMAQRIAVYNRVLAETGDQALAFNQSANVINFLHHGSSQVARALFQTVPFITAYANSIDVLYNALVGGGLRGLDRKKALQRLFVTGSLLSATTIIYSMLVGDDEDYMKMDDQSKVRSYMIPGTDIVLPMNTSAAFFFKAIPELIYNAIVSQGTENEVDEKRLRRAMKEAAVDMLLGPTPVPSAAKPIIEIGLNYNFFTSRSVVPAGLKDLDAYQQYDMRTSEAAKLLSSLTGGKENRVLNPVEADHLIRGIFGTVGGMVAWSSNLIGEASEVRPEMGLKEMPITGAFLRPEVPRGREDLFYNLKESTDRKYKTYMRLVDRDPKEATAYFKRHPNLIAYYEYTSEMDTELKEINAAVRFIGESKDPSLTPEIKKRQIQEFLNLKQDVLKGVERFRKEAYKELQE